MSNDTPILLFDGDCGFCRRSVEKWRPKLKNHVQIHPYQEVIQNYPQLSAEECRESVKLIFQGNVYSAAHAVFKAFSLAGKHQTILWSYEHVPFFAKISEWVYRRVAHNRTRLSKWQRKT